MRFHEPGRPTEGIPHLIPEVVVVRQARHLLRRRRDQARLVVAEVDRPEAGEAVEEARPVLLHNVDVALAANVNFWGRAGVRLVECMKQRCPLGLPTSSRAQAPGCGCREDRVTSSRTLSTFSASRCIGSSPPSGLLLGILARGLVSSTMQGNKEFGGNPHIGGSRRVTGESFQYTCLSSLLLNLEIEITYISTRLGLSTSDLHWAAAR